MTLADDDTNSILADDVNTTIIRSIALYYISLLSGLGNIDDQNRNPNMNNRDHLVGKYR